MVRTNINNGKLDFELNRHEMLAKVQMYIGKKKKKIIVLL